MLDLGGQAGSASEGLGAEVGQMLGDVTEEPSAPEEQGAGTNAGATPANAPPADSEPSPTPVEAPDGEPPAEGSAPAPATPDTAVVAGDADPLAGSTPFSYSVNGQDRTIEGIRVLGDEAVITREGMDDVRRRLGERDHLYEQGQQHFQQQQRTEALSAWKHTAEDGSERLLTGEQGLAEMRVSHARLEAALNTMVAALQDPQRLPQLVAVDDAGNIVLNDAFINQLLTQSELSEIKAEQATRSLIGQLQEAARPAPPALDFKQFAPAIVKQAAGDKLSALTPKDQQALGAQMLRYVRPTTPAERQQGHGAHIVDAEFTSVVQEWANLRSEGAMTATTAISATATNAARIAAARQGGRAAPGTRIKPAPVARSGGMSDADRAWEARENAASGRSR